MAMETVYEELDEVKVENEKLKADLKSKSELCEHLKKIQNELLTNIQEASSKIEKQVEGILEKEEEISVAKRANEDLKHSLYDKEMIVKHLNGANDKLRVERDEKNQKWEQENGLTVLALDEANEKNVHLEKTINVLRAEIIKAHLSVSQNKCLEAKKKAENTKEMRERDDLLDEVGKGRRKVEDELKWKKEQFKYLEEAHEKLLDQFKVSKHEWEQEKSALLDEVSLLKTRLDSQIWITGYLENRLKMCNQVLAHEETRRKYLETEISELKMRFGNIFSEFQDAKSRLDCLNLQRENEESLMEEDFDSSLNSFSSELEIEEKKLMIEELEDDIPSIQEKLLLQEKSLSGSNKLSEKTNLLEDIMKLSMDREILIGFIGGIGDRITEFFREEAQLMGFLERIVQAFDNNHSDFKGSDELFDSLKANKTSLLLSLEEEEHKTREASKKFLSDSKQLALIVEDEMEAKQLEMKNLFALIDELKSEKINLLEDIMKLTTDREILFGFIEGLCDRISKFSAEDVEMVRFLGRIVHSLDSDELFDSLKENKNSLLFSPATNKQHLVIEERSPLTQLN
ncbi:hypothetical protein ES319_1Z103400v1 [Gossypium barbadense]|uniref:Uncharacterized protein n=2 Tax=Gossypium TaxID=3633 RepID=A0A5J5N7J6_GOSBA|nr:hypothetical protein ES319_1Z103400v1 [Gossypium barbadense]TYG75565.1 hypothetical protein ES288_D03G041300v1 [Gossypium darwinii]